MQYLQDTSQIILIPKNLLLVLFRAEYGFFNDNVINLDGKLDHKSLRALSVSRKNKNFDELINYINLRNINVIIDWNGICRKHFRKLIESPDWEYCKDAINNKHGNVQSVCIRKNI